MSAIRLPISLLKTSTFSHKDKSEKHFLYVCNPTDCVTKVETFSEKCKKISQWPMVKG